VERFLLFSSAMRTASLFVCAVFALLGCGGSIDTSAPDSGADAPSTQPEASVTPDASDGGAVTTDAGYPGPHAPVPQVQDYGGPVLSAPNVIPIFFPNDSQQSQVEDFLSQLSTSTFWGEATSEYGAGPLTIGSSIVVTDTPPTTIDLNGVQSWLENYLDGTHTGWPPVAQNDIFTIFYPSTTTISDPNFGTSCTSFGGYHAEAKGTGGTSIVYAVMPRCATFGQSIHGFDALTAGLSHELIEASTDPLQSNPAWSYVDLDHMVWNLMPLGEIGDMCAYEPQSFQRLVGSYLVQRPWSNASALAGDDPCVPVLSQPYFNAAPVLTDSVNIDYYGQQVSTLGVTIPLNQSKTIDVQLFSDAPTNDWIVQAVDSTYGTTNPTELTFSWDAQSGNNGDTLHLTITRIANGSHLGSEFMIWAEHGTTTANLWFGFVAN